MTTYTTTFAGETVAAASSTMTNRFATAAGTLIQNPADGEAESDRALSSDGEDSGIQMWSLDAIDGDANRDNCEMLCRFRVDNDSTENYSVWGRASGSSGSETGYRVQAENGTMLYHRFNAGTETLVSTGADLDFPATAPITGWWLGTGDIPSWSNSPEGGIWLWLRFRINGIGATVTLSAKYWLDGLPEPSNGFMYVRTDTNASRVVAAGWCGWGRTVHTSTEKVELDYFSAASNGDTPAIAISADLAIIRLTQTNTMVATQDADPIVRLTQVNTMVATQEANPEMRITGSYAQVVYSFSVPPTPQTPDLMVPT